MNRIETPSPGGGSPGPAAGGSARGIARAGASDPDLERIVRVAAGLFDAPSAAVALIENGRLETRAAIGPNLADGLCADMLAEPAHRLGQPIFVADTGHGEPRFYAVAPLLSADGRIIGLLCAADTRPHAEPSALQRQALPDLAGLAATQIALAAEAAAAREEAQLDRERMGLALNAAGLVGYEWDMHQERVIASEAMKAMVGWDPARGPVVDRAAVRAMLHPDDRDQAVATLRQSLAAYGRYTVETRIIRPIDGKVAWVSSAGAFVATDEGEPHRVIGVIQDITARKTEEDQRETLVAELDHRVKNVIAAVQSLAAQSARKAVSLEGFLKTFAGRLKSMASAHQLLTATRWRGAGMHNIAAAELGGLAPGQTRWSGPDVLLTPRGANAMSLALHELATNAIKFGALSTEVGRVEVVWRRTDAGGLELQWAESHGPEVKSPTRRGFGATLLDKVTGRELDGSVRMDYRAEGVRAVLTVGPSAFAATPQAEPDAKAAAAAPTLTGASDGGPASGQAIRVQGLKILIVEDALLLALELEAGLSEAGAEVVGSAADVSEAMRMADLPIDAAVLDANLNGASVLPVAQILAQRGIPFVFATGYGDDKMLPAGFDAPVIRKPYDVTQVAAALSEVTGRTTR